MLKQFVEMRKMLKAMSGAGQRRVGASGGEADERGAQREDDDDGAHGGNTRERGVCSAVIGRDS